MTLLVVSLKNKHLCANQNVGGKAARLAELIAEGFTVPDAYALTTFAFEKYCQFNNIDLKASGAQEAIIKGRFPDELVQELDHVKAFFKGKDVAIRSSGVGEDGFDNSLAGQLKTFLGKDNWEDSIRECWAAIFLDRVASYAQAKGSESLTQMGVVIQELVHADKAGVAYTVNPSEKSADNGVIEWVDGLGDKLVDGAVTPQRCYVSRLTKKVIGVDDKAWGDTLSELSRQCYQIETMFNYPVDVEWAVKDNKIYILQARPVTAFFSENANILSSANIAENFPGQLTPLTKDVSENFYSQYMRSSLQHLGAFDKHYHTDNMLNALLAFHEGSIFYNLSNWYAVIEACPLNTWIRRGFDLYVGQTVPGTQVPKAKKSGASYLASRLRTFATLSWRIFNLENELSQFEQSFKQAKSRWRNITSRSCSPLELNSLWDEINQWSGKNWGPAGLADFSVLVTSGLIQFYVEKLSAQNQAEAVRVLLGGIVVESTDSAKLIQEIANLISKDNELTALLNSKNYAQLESIAGKEIQQRLSRFMDEFGGRSYNESVLTTPTFEEQHDYFWDLVASHLNSPHTGAKHQESKNDPDLSSLPWSTRISQAFIKKFANRALNNRERGRLIFGLYMAEIRRVALTIGEQFVQWRYLNAKEDIFYLSSQEITDTLQGKLLYSGIKEFVELRKKLQTESEALTLAEFMIWEHGRKYGLSGNSHLSDNENMLHGLGVSGGKAKAHACVVLDPTKGNHDVAGKILIAKTTDPGWTPLIASAKGVIVERGGLLSHAAIVAREFGIPTVVGINNATSIIPQGLMIEIDGDAGTVDLEHDEKEVA
ncbi:hypothetical protein KIH87_12325 [Paraneptunicella aestuarii]|uniref:PEP/pyruvate-binding domain-containing protein n=1 Tax=Paraneptunicella aestuarii TaxID=2831148 RepID=UPI001E3D2676|nr:PEP/pyruvate-binding domain-containing protein [Paraneptunicella aestuarii]UAA37498.1 hypothetical protein KIH87_12325 [Paraneptunicella aestuarii]